MFKETAVSDINTTTPEGAKTHEVEILDCGKASEETKGFLLLLFYEPSIPPFDRQLIF